ncbi:MAG: RES family NAD+ phosphorylase [Herbaspirillum sp.]
MDLLLARPKFAHLTLADVHGDLLRNIVSIGASQDLFDDLSDDHADWLLAQRVEDQVKPLTFQSRTPVIHRPFEDAAWWNAIDWPFKHWQTSRFSDGTFGVWYGCDTVETSVHETVYHWYHGLLQDAGFETEPVSMERKVYQVVCDAALLDLRPVVQSTRSTHADLMHKTDYQYAQSVGLRLHQEGHPGLVTKSVRCAGGDNFVVFNPAVLSNPRQCCQLNYHLDGQHVIVEKQAGTTWLEVLV